MSNFLIAFLFTIGASTWIYTKIYSRTGGNTQNAFIVATVSGIAIFILMLIILAMIGARIG